MFFEALWGERQIFSMTRLFSMIIDLLLFLNFQSGTNAWQLIFP